MAIQVLFDESVSMTPEEFSSIATKVAAVNTANHIDDALRMGAAEAALGELWSKDVARAQEVEALVMQLRQYRDELAVRYDQCLQDYLSNGKFRCLPRSEGLISERPVGLSHIHTDIVVAFGRYTADLGFRSDEYPDLNYIMAQALHMRQELEVALGDASPVK